MSRETSVDSSAMVATGGGDATITVLVADRPSTVAVMVALPGATAVTSPAPLTVATPAAEDDQATDRPPSVSPALSTGVAASCVVSPTVVTTDDGEIVTDATGGKMKVIVAVPFRPSLVAVIVTEPAPRPVTVPLCETVATDALDELHEIARPTSARPEASLGTADTARDSPTRRLALVGVTDTVATSADVTLKVGVPETGVGVLAPPPTSAGQQ